MLAKKIAIVASIVFYTIFGVNSYDTWRSKMCKEVSYNKTAAAMLLGTIWPIATVVIGVHVIVFNGKLNHNLCKLLQKDG